MDRIKAVFFNIFVWMKCVFSLTPPNSEDLMPSPSGEGDGIRFADHTKLIFFFVSMFCFVSVGALIGLYIKIETFKNGLTHVEFRKEPVNPVYVSLDKFLRENAILEISGNIYIVGKNSASYDKVMKEKAERDRKSVLASVNNTNLGSTGSNSKTPSIVSNDAWAYVDKLPAGDLVENVTFRRMAKRDTIEVKLSSGRNKLIRLAGISVFSLVNDNYAQKQAKTWKVPVATILDLGKNNNAYIKGLFTEGEELVVEYFNKRDRDNKAMVFGYVYKPDGMFVNGTIMKNGQGFLYISERGMPHIESLQAYQKTAITTKSGIWNLINLP